MYSAVPEIEIEQPAVARSSTTTRSVVYTAVGLLLAASCVVMLTSTETAFPTQTTDLASFFAGETELVAGPPKAEDCANVKDWNFDRKTVDDVTNKEVYLVQVTQNNLGGQGPDKGGNEEIRYSNVADEIDLILTIPEGSYTTNPTCKDEAKNKCIMPEAGCPKAGMTCGRDANGLLGRFGQVNIKGGTAAKLKFTLVDAGTNNPIDIDEDQKVFFSVFDLDNNGGGTQEVLTLDTEPESYELSTGSPATEVVQISNSKFRSSQKGNDDDNPTDPLNMTPIQLQRAVWVTYKGKNTWTMTFEETGNDKGKGGRNLLFAGRAQGACPPGKPVAPPPGACPAGIEGMIKGGGRVCCPQECDGSGGPEWVKHADAPNHCGGPACDKSPSGEQKKNGKPVLGGLPGSDGKGGRTQERYDNCCIGKPVKYGTEKTKITAPYGILAQLPRRFCADGDAPPCINKLPKVSDRI